MLPNLLFTVSPGVEIIEWAFKLKMKYYSFINEYIGKFRALKYYFDIFSVYELTDTKSFNSTNKLIAESDNNDKIFKTFKGTIIVKAENLQQKDSDKALQQILFLDVNIMKHNPLFTK